MNLTPKQLNIVNYVREYAQAKSYAPTLQEIAQHFSVSAVTIFEHLNALEKKGAIRRSKHKTRSIEILGNGSAKSLMVKGTIAAGSPIETMQESEHISLDELFQLAKNPFVLRVKGDSMIQEHICDGDYIVVEPRQWAQDGETVVALVNGAETTLKKYYREGNLVRLQPANPNMAPIYAEDVQVQGVVIGVVRKN